MQLFRPKSDNTYLFSSAFDKSNLLAELVLLATQKETENENKTKKETGKDGQKMGGWIKESVVT